MCGFSGCLIKAFEFASFVGFSTPKGPFLTNDVYSKRNVSKKKTLQINLRKRSKMGFEMECWYIIM
ncbi:CLUMA_CG014818, isoform A [Clunio marinus]|uniref:CLUMA_CG014818, isoform A n=1 Tax=Clunio marinus TaxID=568069 RepID=A0A1J1IPR6_9DIPT|nr:CLUMA_CG014818, isoform A [Clunio marinus]